jgi:histidine triad (HIT) family protein
MTIFEKIAAREIPADIVFEEDEFVAFRDTRPQAPVHVLIIPRRHIARVADTDPKNDALLLGKMLCASGEIARRCGVGETGYRLVINNGRDAGESVPHLHIHLLGGRSLHWPPG